MKTFMEEYGLIIVGILVVAALIGLAINFSQDAKKNSQDSIDKFNEKATGYIEKGLDDKLSNNNNNSETQTQPK